MNLIFTLLLGGVLAAAMASFLVMGLLQNRRRTHLARRAHAGDMRFAAEDPFDVVTRYGEFALFAAGHSGRAHNVTHGQVEGGLAVRAFDFRYEVGHGIRREMRRYVVVALEAARPLPGVLMWHESDWEQAPLSAVRADRECEPWRFRGDPAWAEALAAAASAEAPELTGIQTRGELLFCWAPLGRRGERDYRVLPERIATLLQAAREQHEKPSREASPDRP